MRRAHGTQGAERRCCRIAMQKAPYIWLKILGVRAQEMSKLNLQLLIDELACPSRKIHIHDRACAACGERELQENVVAVVDELLAEVRDGRWRVIHDAPFCIEQLYVNNLECQTKVW